MYDSFIITDPNSLDGCVCVKVSADFGVLLLEYVALLLIFLRVFSIMTLCVLLACNGKNEI